MTLTRVTSDGITDAAIVNADINASAAIAGTKISPNFGSQNIETTGTLSCGDITSSDGNGNLTLKDNNHTGSNCEHLINFTASDDTSLMNIGTPFGSNALFFKYGSTELVKIDSNAQVDFAGNVDCNAGLDVTGNITATGHVALPDNSQLRLGTVDDLKIFHNGTDSIINTITGSLLYQYNGTTVALQTDTRLGFQDNKKASFGTGNDLEIYHDPQYGHSFIKESGSGGLIFGANLYEFYNAAINEKMITATENGGVALYNDNVLKFNTNVNGVTCHDDLAILDNNKATFGTSNDLQIYHDSSGGGDSYITNSNGNLNIVNSTDGWIRLQPKSGEEGVIVKYDGAVELYHDNSKKFETASHGCFFDGTGGDTYWYDGSGSNDLKWLYTDNVKNCFGTGSDLQIYHNGSHSYITDVGTGNLNIEGNGASIRINNGSSENMAVFYNNAQVELFYDNTKMVETTSDGCTIQKGLTVKGIEGGEAQIRIEADEADNASDRFRLIATDSAGFQIQSYDGSQYDTLLKGVMNGGVNLYYNNVLKFETTSVGVTLFDTCITNNEIRPADDNTHSIGRSNRRYITYFGVNGSINTSDKNEKNTIIESDLGLDFINKLKPISYKWNKDDGKTHYGLIAQDLEETLTSIGKTIADFGGIYKEDDSPMGLGYSELISPLIKAIQELSSEVAALKAG